MANQTGISGNLTICNSPIVLHNLAILRDKNTAPEAFRVAIKRISQILVQKAYDNIPLVPIRVATPLQETECRIIDCNAEFIVSPILRAGLSFSEVALDILPIAKVHHIGLYRDEKTLKPICYYNNLLTKFNNPSETYVYILDPMLATGGSAAASVKLFTELDVPQENISFVSLIAAPEGVNKLLAEFNNIRIIVAALDSHLNELGYIVPGLGDAGDRTYNTKLG